MLTRFRRKAICLGIIPELLAGAQLAARGQQTIGQIVSSAGASVGGVPVPGQGTVLAGDTLSTVKGGSALVKISASTQLSLAEDTSVSFSSVAGHPVAKIASGVIVADAQGADALTIEAPRCRISAAQPAATTFLISVRPDGATLVTARHGLASITETGASQAKTLAEGDTTECAAPPSPGQEKEAPKPAPGEPAGQAPPKPPEVHHGSGTLILVGVAAAAGIGAAVAAAGGGGGGGGPVSPSQP